MERTPHSASECRLLFVEGLCAGSFLLAAAPRGPLLCIVGPAFAGAHRRICHSFVPSLVPHLLPIRLYFPFPPSRVHFPTRFRRETDAAHHSHFARPLPRITSLTYPNALRASRLVPATHTVITIEGACRISVTFAHYPRSLSPSALPSCAPGSAPPRPRPRHSGCQRTSSTPAPRRRSLRRCSSVTRPPRTAVSSASPS